MAMATWRVVVAREGIARPNNHNIGECFEDVALLRTVVHALESGVGRHRPRFILARKVFFKLLVLCDNRVGHGHAPIVENTGHFSSSFE